MTSTKNSGSTVRVSLGVRVHRMQMMIYPQDSEKLPLWLAIFQIDSTRRKQEALRSMGTPQQWFLGGAEIEKMVKGSMMVDGYYKKWKRS